MKAQPSYPKIIIHRLGGPVKTAPRPRHFPLVPTVLISSLLTLSAIGFFPNPFTNLAGSPNPIAAK